MTTSQKVSTRLFISPSTLAVEKLMIVSEALDSRLVEEPK
jgi:hypothetical protein